MDQVTFDKLTQDCERNITAKVIADSVAPNGCRLTTMEWTYPRMIHSEIMTHRNLSRNSASSRAIPLAKMIKRVQELPVFPIHWGKNQKGMQATEELSPTEKLDAASKWMYARVAAMETAMDLERIGVHKQIGNRLLEPWMWITVIVSATNLENLFGLRCHKDAEPHFQNLAYKVREAFDYSTPVFVPWGEWHLPYFGTRGGNHEDLALSQEHHPRVSAGRCARVSYLTQDGKRDPALDIQLYERLAGQFPIHASPLEHPAMACDPSDESELFLSLSQTSHYFKELGEGIDWGNFDPGWLQFRKMHENENITKRVT